MPSGQDLADPDAVVDRIEQGRADTHFFEEALHAGHVAPQRFHLGSVEQRRALDDHAGEAVGPQPDQCLKRRQFLHPARLQLPDHDPRGVCLAHRQFGKLRPCFFINGLDGLSPGLVIRRPEMDHQQCRFFLCSGRNTQRYQRRNEQ